MVAPSLDGRVLLAGDTEIVYREADGVVWAHYRGGSVRHGRLVGTRTGDDLALGFVHLLVDGTVATGQGASRVEEDEDGRLRLHEEWTGSTPATTGGRVVTEALPLVHPSGVSLRPIVGEDGGRAVMRLKVAPEQEGFVAPNPVSLAQGQAEDPPGWMRGVWHEERPVGFVMLADYRHEGHGWFLWRFMIAANEQRKGYGRAALELLCEHVQRGSPPHELGVSWVDEPGGPGPFYLGFGFELTGEVDEDEVVARLVRWPDGAGA